MCRAILEGGRRCPNCSGGRRRAADRARYAGHAAAKTTVSPSEHAPAGPPPVQQLGFVQEGIALQEKMSHLHDSLTNPSNREFLWVSPDELGDPEMVLRAEESGQTVRVAYRAADLENEVTAFGARVEERAAEITGFSPEDVQQNWQERADAAEKESNALLNMEKPAELAYNEYLNSSREDSSLRNDPEFEIERRRLFSAYANEGDRYRAQQHELGKVVQGTDTETVRQLQQLSDGYRQAVAEVRPLGGEIVVETTTQKKRLKKVFSEIAEVYPTAWIEASNNGPALIAKHTTGRAHYSAKKGQKKRVQNFRRGRAYSENERGFYLANGYAVSDDDPDVYVKKAGYRFRTEGYSSEITVDTDPRRFDGHSAGYATAMHEWAHRMEHINPSIAYLEKSFLTRRTTGSDGTRDRLEPYSPRSRRELLRPDNFVNRYIGKEYGSQECSNGDRTYQVPFTEVMSMGMESLHTGQDGGLVGVGKHHADPDMRRFVLGVLATA